MHYIGRLVRDRDVYVCGRSRETAAAAVNVLFSCVEFCLSRRRGIMSPTPGFRWYLEARRSELEISFFSVVRLSCVSSARSIESINEQRYSSTPSLYHRLVIRYRYRAAMVATGRPNFTDLALLHCCCIILCYYAVDRETDTE